MPSSVSRGRRRRIWLTPPVHEPALSMLWESDDPTEQLEKRFGFRGGAAVADWVAGALARWWAADVTACERVVISSWNAMAWVVVGDQRRVVKWSALPHRFATLSDSAQLVTWLGDRGLPVVTPIPATDGRLLVECGNETRGRLASRLPLPGQRFLVGVLPVVEGELLDVDDPAQVRDAGRMLASLHAALAVYPDRVGRGRRSARPRGRKQLVHHDFRSANILHDGTRITAVLDFEEVTYATRVADLARAAVLLGTRYRNWRPTSPEVRDAFVSAYDELAEPRLTDAERSDFDDHVAANLEMNWWAPAT